MHALQTKIHILSAF